jgi:microcin C transport system substrate-binding protein
MNEIRRRLDGTWAAALAAVVSLVLLSDATTRGQAAAAASAETAPAAATASSETTGGHVTLPEHIAWETNDDDPLIGSPDAIRGGTFNYVISAYPLTQRLMGPNSNDEFSAWNRLSTLLFTLVEQHPVTDRFIPMLATAWSIQPDQRTIYFKLDPDARFSDGTPVTADDYVFTWKMMQSEYILDPFYNDYAKQFYESVDKIDDYTLRIVGTRPSWRPLYDYGELWPTPAHAVVLDKDWVNRTTNQPQIVVGPYVVAGMSRGQSVTLERVKNWWGDNKRYFKGRFNFDRIYLRVIPPARVLDYLRRGELDLAVERSSRTWNEEYTFPAVRNGWLRRARVFVDTPAGTYGLNMNLEAPIFQNKDFRKAMQYLFNFERLNRNLMYNEYFREVSFFEGTQYADTSLKSYPFDPQKAEEYLRKAGYHPPTEPSSRTLFGGLRDALWGLLFIRSDADDPLVNDRGDKASFAVLYGDKGLERHLTVMQQDYRRAGVDMHLRLLEPGTAFERGLERKYEMMLDSRSASFYPDPRQYLGTEFKNATNNNDVWGFGSTEVDALIKTYEEDPDFQHRLDAMHRIDDIVQDEAFYIPFWRAPYIRLAYWDYVQFPPFYLPKRTLQITDYMVYWIDPARKAKLEQAMQIGEAYPVDQEMDKDFYGVRQNLH